MCRRASHSRTPSGGLAALSIAPVIALICALLAAAPAMGTSVRELKDPTRPPSAPATAEIISGEAEGSPYVLSAILVAEGRRIAVINGELVQAGDQVMQAKVLRILGDRVVLLEADDELTLRLVPRGIRKSEGASQ